MRARSNGALNAYTVCGKSNRHAKLDAMVNFLKLKEKYVYMREVEALMVLMRVIFTQGKGDMPPPKKAYTNRMLDYSGRRFCSPVLTKTPRSQRGVFV